MFASFRSAWTSIRDLYISIPTVPVGNNNCSELISKVSFSKSCLCMSACIDV